MAASSGLAAAVEARWQRWTAPHPSVRASIRVRRLRLAANLLLVLMPLSLVFLLAFDLRDLALGRWSDGLLSLAVFVGFAAAYGLVRSPAYRWGVALCVGAPWLVLWSQVWLAPDPTLLYFTVVPVLLGALLLERWPSTLFSLANLVAVAAVPAVLPEAGLAVASQDFYSIFLFLATGSALALVGAGFLDRSVRALDQANARLERAEGFRTRLLNTIAHDLASPLSTIKLQLHMMGQSGEPRARLLRRNVDLVERLVRDVSDLAKLEADELRLEKAPVDLAEAVREVAEGFAQRAAEKGLELQVRAPDSVLVDADRDRIGQVLHNLLSNAVKFTPPGGRVEAEVTTQTGAAQVLVRDTGRGLEPGEVSRLFRPFSQVHDRHEVAERGTGLGLYIAKGIVEAHGGRAWVESAGRGRGSLFAFALPVQAG